MKFHFDQAQFDDEEQATMETLDKAFEEGTLVFHFTAERQAELQEAARNTLNPSKNIFQHACPNVI